MTCSEDESHGDSNGKFKNLKALTDFVHKLVSNPQHRALFEKETNYFGDYLIKRFWK